MTPPDFRSYEFAVVLHETLSRDRLLSLCQGFGLEFSGVRLKSVPAWDMACALADVFLESDREDQRVFIQALDAATGTLRENISRMTVREIEDNLSKPDKFGPGVRPGQIIYALRMDGRGGLARSARSMALALSAAKSLIPRESADSGKEESAEEAAPSKRIPPDVEESLKTAESDLAELKHLLAKSFRVDAREKQQLSELKLTVEQLKKDVHDRDEKLSGLRAEISRLQTDKANLTQELDALRARHDRGVSERDLRKAEYEREKLSEKVTKLEADLKVRAAAESALKEKSEENRRLADSLNRVHQEAEGLRRRLDTLNAKLTEKKDGARPPAARDPGRVVVLLDTHSLFFPARARNLRIDFQAFLAAATGNAKLGAAVAYVLERAGSNAAAFKRALEEFGYLVRSWTIDPGGPEPWLEALASDIRAYSPGSGKIVLASHTASLAPAVSEAVASGCVVTLAAFPSDAPQALKSAASDILPIGETLSMPAFHKTGGAY